MTSPIRTAAIDALLVFRFGPDPDIPPSVRIQAGRLLDALTAHFLSEAEGAKKTSGHYGGNGRPHTYWHGTPCDCSWGADHGNGTGDAPDFAAPATGKRTPLDSSSAKGDEELGRIAYEAYNSRVEGAGSCWDRFSQEHRDDWHRVASAVRAAVEASACSEAWRSVNAYAAERDAALARVEEIRIAHGSALNRVAEMERELAVLKTANAIGEGAYQDGEADMRERAAKAAEACASASRSNPIWEAAQRGIAEDIRALPLTAPTAPAAEKTDNSPPARGERGGT